MEAGERKYVLMAVCIVVVCLTVLYLLLFVALWQFKLVVGGSLLVILLCGTFCLCVVALRGTTHQQFHTPPYLPVKQEQGYYDRFS